MNTISYNITKMKFNKILSMALMFPALAALYSCAEEYDYTPVTFENGQQVYFPESVKTNVSITDLESSFLIDINRVDKSADAFIELKYEADETTAPLFEVPSVVTFAEGSTTAQIECKVVGELEYDVTYKFTLSVANAEDATNYGWSSVVMNVVCPAPWKSLGMATVVDDIMTSGWNVPYNPFQVEIQENELTPGLYRLVNPYTSSYPYNEPGDYDDSKDYYLEIHAEDPDAVWFGRTELGLDWGYGMITAWSIADYYVQNGNDPELVKEKGFYGTLKNGEITFPAKAILFNMPQHPNGNNWYYSNSKGMFSILLPGYVKADYSVSVEYAGIFTKPDGSNYAVANVALGPDAKNVKAIVMPSDVDAAAVADAIAAGDLEGDDVAAGRIEVPFKAEELGGSKFQIIVVVVANGEAKGVASTSFEYYSAGNDNPWKSIGTGYYTDDVLTSMWGLPAVSYEVEILEHDETPGLYRLVDPYSNSLHPYASAFNEQLGAKLASDGLYLEVNATDSEGVYVQPQSLGLNFGDGDWVFTTMGAYYLANGYPFETVKSNGLLGKVVDGVITFPAFNYDKSDGTQGIYQGLLYEGESGPYYAAYNGKMQIVLPESNAFARNMAKANNESTKITRSRVKAEKKFNKLFHSLNEILIESNL